MVNQNSDTNYNISKKKYIFAPPMEDFLTEKYLFCYKYFYYSIYIYWTINYDNCLIYSCSKPEIIYYCSRNNFSCYRH